MRAETTAPVKAPSVRVTEIVAGLCEIRPGLRYVVPKQPYSAMYLPETRALDFKVDGGAPVRVEPGGMFALPNGAAHALALPNPAKGAQASLQPPFTRTEIKDQVAVGSGVVLALRVPTSANPIPDIIPRAVHLTADDLRRESQLDLVLRLVRDNALREKADRTQIMHRLAEIVAIVLIDMVLRELKSDGLNTINAIGDSQLRRALAAMHDAPEKLWTLSSLAAHAGLSRSAFADRFKETLDQTPMNYLTSVRIARATRLLRSGERTIAQIGHACGYKSDASFYKAFKRLIGASPKEYRNSHGQS